MSSSSSAAAANVAGDDAAAPGEEGIVGELPSISLGRSIHSIVLVTDDGQAKGGTSFTLGPRSIFYEG